MPELHTIIAKAMNDADIHVSEEQRFALIHGIQNRILEAQRNASRSVTVAPQNLLVRPLSKDTLLNETPIYDQTLRDCARESLRVEPNKAFPVEGLDGSKEEALGYGWSSEYFDF